MRSLARAYLRKEPSGTAGRLRWYVAELLRWNRGTNLISRKLESRQVDRLILDSLALASLVPSGPARCADIGSGAGLPGVVLALALRDLEVHLVERRRKRAIFLEHLRDRLEIANLRVHALDLREMLRAEDAPGGFDLVTIRAVGPVELVMRKAAPLIRSGGRMLVLTGEGVEVPLPVERIPTARCIPGAGGCILRWDVPRETPGWVEGTPRHPGG